MTQWVAGATRLVAVRSALGTAGPLPSPESAARHNWSGRDQATTDSITAGHVVGDQDHVHDALRTLVEQTGADELMITANVHGYEDHVRRLQLIAEAMDAPSDATGSRVSVR